jgi:hypothetical protein
MNEFESRQGPSIAAVAAGAALGALAIYVLRTEKGRQLLNEAVRLLDDFSSECARFQQAAVRAQSAVSEGWQAVKDSTMSNTGGGRETVF